MLERLRIADPALADAIFGELKRQRYTLELIASENFVPVEVLEAQGSVLTNKYAEGYPGKRYHAGCEWIDVVESLAIERAKELFGAEYVNVQPHSGVNANLAVYIAMLQAGDTVLGMSLDQGGHLSHGSKANISGKYYNFHLYGLDPKTELIDYDGVEQLAKEQRPKLIVAGASAYPRLIDYQRLRAIADEVGAHLMVDMSHIAGLVAGKAIPSPVPYAHFVTSTTTKTLQGARGGLILAKKEFGPKIDRAIFPGIQGGPCPQIMAGKAYTFKRALSEEFQAYARQVINNAQTLAGVLAERGLRVVSGGTDNHLLLVDVRPLNITGQEAEDFLSAAGIMVNKNMIPFDPEPPTRTSGIRIGTAAVTSRGAKEKDLVAIGHLIADILASRGDKKVQEQAQGEVQAMCECLPLYPGLEDR